MYIALLIITIAYLWLMTETNWLTVKLLVGRLSRVDLFINRTMGTVAGIITAVTVNSIVEDLLKE